MKKKVRGSQVVFSLVFLVLGFMIAFSFDLTQNEKKSGSITTDRQYERDLELRNQLIEQEQKNTELQRELKDKQDKVLDIENDLANQAKVFYRLAEETEKYRMFVGKVRVKGKGVQITLDDGDYNPNVKNVNSYIVHEHHIFKVVNELYISGATAVAINGQRLSHDSYILCNGPVIEIDGYQHPAPFIITAIGDTDVLSAALNITGGVKDSLVNENIIFTLEKKDEIILEPILGS